MSIRNLKSFFRPRSVALVGASTRPGSVGNVLARNLQTAGFGPDLSFVHPRGETILGVDSAPSVAALPEAPELAVLATPPDTVPGLVRELGERGTRAVVVISAFRASAALADGTPLHRALLEATRPHGVRVIGPNCLGILAPPARLNASFSHLSSSSGNLAFVAQSGAMVAAVQDWAEPRAVGFSHLVSLGDMLDVDFGDMLDYLANDPRTDAILLYVEGIKHTRKFMSAARAASRVKPVVAVKSGRFGAGARAAALHSGAEAGSDAVYDAAFRRSGILRVYTLEELFSAVETLSLARRHRGDRLAIVTNGGGLGVLAADALSEADGRLADLSSETVATLSAILPERWSGGNPVDIGGDAPDARYEAVLRVILEDAGVDAVLVVNSPAAGVSRREAAQAVANASVARRGKTLLTSWVGAATTGEALRVFAEAAIPSYDTPEQAVRAFLQLVEFGVRQDLLLETPPSLPEAFEPGTGDVERIIAGALEDGREWLSGPEVWAALEAYGIPTASPRATGGASEAGAHGPPGAWEVAIRVRDDPWFGPMIGFGQGGTAAEVVEDRAMGFPPLNLRLARALMSRTHIQRVLEGHRDVPSTSLDAVALALVKVSQLVVDVPQVEELDLDPVRVDLRDMVVVDARLRVRTREEVPYPRLAIRPYPKQLEETVELADGRVLLMRPVLPEDEPALQRMFRGLTPDEVRYRFFVPHKTFSHMNTARFTQIDYDREMVLVLTESGIPGEAPVHGLVQLSADPDNEKAEFAVLVGRELTAMGLGVVLTRKLVDYARDRGIKLLFGDVLADNTTMLKLARVMGFRVRAVPGEAGTVRIELPLQAG